MSRLLLFAGQILLLLTVWGLPQTGVAQESKKLVIVCSTTQVADFTRQIVGDRCVVRSILTFEEDPHLRQIKPGDNKIIAAADLCLENGWHLEGKDWMRSLAEQGGKQLVSCVEGVTPLQLEADGKPFRDPHAWFSPKNASVYVRNILKAVCQLDPDHQDEYRARADLYLAELRTLHFWILKQCNSVPADQRVLVTSHDAFNYFCRAYGFKSAAPVGWSTGKDAGGDVTPARRRATIDSIKSFGVKAIFVETSVNQQLIRTIARDSGVVIGGELYSDAMGAQGSAGETYIGMMRENVLAITSALK